MRKLAILGSLILPAAAIALSCSPAPTSPNPCPVSSLRLIIQPVDTTLQVGESFAPTVRLMDGCGAPLPDRITYSSRNDSVVWINQLLRRVTARRPGLAVIGIAGSRYHSLGSIRVAVVE